MPGKMVFSEILSPAPREAWERAASAAAHTLVFQTPAWTDSLTSTGKFQDASRLYRTLDGRELVLPLVRSAAPHLRLSTLASMPDGWGMGGLLSAGPIRPEDVAQVMEDLSTDASMNITIRPNPLDASAWPGQSCQGFAALPRETHVLDLEGGFEQVWAKRFPTATRTKIRRSEKAGVTVRFAEGEELLPLFYQIYMQWIQRRAGERKMPAPLAAWLGKRREPLEKFEHAARILGSRFLVWIAEVNQQPAAASILLLDQHAFYWRSASIKELAGPSRANDYLQYRMIEHACHSGCRYYHMGESGGVDSLKHFKSRFGAETFPYYGYYREKLPVARAKKWAYGLIGRMEHSLLSGKKKETGTIDETA